jgi:hypothetical protein
MIFCGSSALSKIALMLACTMSDILEMSPILISPKN